MELRQALRQLRDELHLRQNELAQALDLNITTVNRWETGKNFPTRSTSMRLLHAAKKLGASEICLSSLRDALFQDEQTDGIDTVKYVHLEQVNQMLNDSSNAVYVCDRENYDILYLNHRVADMVGKRIESAAGKKCYEFLHDRTAPCEFCRLDALCEQSYASREYPEPREGKYYMMRGKLITWQGRRAHIQYVTDITDLYNAREALKRSREMLSVACRAARVWAFTIDLNTRTVYVEPFVQEAFHLPAVIPDFKRALDENDWMPKESVALFKECLDELRNGEKSAESRFMTNFNHIKSRVLFRANLSRLDETGSPALAVCSFQTLTEEE